MTYWQLNKKIREKLDSAGIDNPAWDARAILLEAANMTVETYLASVREEVPAETVRRAERMAERRAGREPLQYILGRAGFFGYEFSVRPGVLIPRYDTEILVEKALAYVRPGQKILDLCTGSGCILLTVLLEAKRRFSGFEPKETDRREMISETGDLLVGEGTDISDIALSVANENARGLGVTNASFVKSDLFTSVRGRYDIITSNPPYIRTQVIGTLSPEVKDHEPRLALDGSADGLLFYRRIAEGAPGFLTEGGRLIFEIGSDEADAVAEIMQVNGFKEIRVDQDLSGNDRVVSGKIDS